MKVINIIGHSCSGKTTFISGLVVRLEDLGTVATIKHLGHHTYGLEPGKDTTVFFESGVGISAGIDDEKTVLNVRNNDLTSILDLLADRGIDFTVIEGFKTIGLPAVVIGDLASDNAIFRNPETGTLLNGLELFPEYITMKSIAAGLIKSLQAGPATISGINSAPPSLSCSNNPVQLPREIIMTVTIPVILSEIQKKSGYIAFREIVLCMIEDLSNNYYPSRIVAGVRNCWQFPIDCEILVAVAAKDVETASVVISAISDRIKKDLPREGRVTK